MSAILVLLMSLFLTNLTLHHAMMSQTRFHFNTTSSWVEVKTISGPRREKTCLRGVCEQHRRRPACASAQSDQRLCYSLLGNYYM